MSDCYRCQGPLAKKHAKTDWEFLGATFHSVTESTATTDLIVTGWSVKHTDHGARPRKVSSSVALCFDCHGAVMSFIGVGKRPEDRMPR